MNAKDLLDDLALRGVAIERRGDRLHVDAPAGVISESEWKLLGEHRDALLKLVSPPPLDTERDLAAAWRGAAHELSEMAGHPHLALEPHRSIPPGQANWLRWIARASVPDLVLVVAALRELLARMPRSGEGRMHDDG